MVYVDDDDGDDVGDDVVHQLVDVSNQWMIPKSNRAKIEMTLKMVNLNDLQHLYQSMIDNHANCFSMNYDNGYDQNYSFPNGIVELWSSIFDQMSMVAIAMSYFHNQMLSM